MTTTKKHKYVKPPLMERFAGTVPEFQAEMHAIAAAGHKTIEYVFGLWCEYGDKCHDQSALVSEFKEWYAKQLAPTPKAPMAERTPGPWQYRRDSDGNIVIEFKGEPKMDGFYEIRPVVEDIWGNNEANARLIAAAPELLESLAALAYRLKDSDDTLAMAEQKGACALLARILGVDHVGPVDLAELRNSTMEGGK